VYPRSSVVPAGASTYYGHLEAPLNGAHDSDAPDPDAPDPGSHWQRNPKTHTGEDALIQMLHHHAEHQGR